MKQLLIAAVASLAVLSSLAKESAWIGPSSGGAFGDAANWDNGVPGPGDTAVFATAATVSQATELVNLGAAGLTVNNTADVTFAFRLKGSGQLVKRGSGKLVFKAHNLTGSENAYTGGLRVEAGVFDLILKDADSSGWSLADKSTQVFGPGTFAVTGTGSFLVNSYNATVDNPIVITNFTGGCALQQNGPTTWSSAITAYDDFTLANNYESLKFGGKVSASGHTMTITAPSWSWKWGQISGVIDANLVMDTQNDTMQFTNKSMGPGNTLTVKSPYVEMAGGATWGGLVVVDGSTAKIKSTGGCNFCETTSITLKNGGKIDLQYNSNARRFVIGSTAQPDGVYTKDNSDGGLSNNGKLTVNGAVKLWTGAGDKVWTNAANWDGGVPASGNTALFGADAVLAAASVDVGASGLTLDCRGNVSGPLSLSGSGLLVKKGAGKFTTGVRKYALTGGVRIEAGVLSETMSGEGFNCAIDALGAGTIEVTGSGQIYFNCYRSTNTQAVVIHDHDGSVAPVYSSGSLVNLGTITSDGDFTINAPWDTPRFLGKISAPGKTVTFTVPNWNTAWYYADTEFADVDASIRFDVNNGKTMILSGAFERTENSLTLVHGKISTPVVQRWGAISLADKTSATIPSRVTLACNALSVAGVKKANGVYRKGSLPGVVLGDGRLLVGQNPGLSICVR